MSRSCACGSVADLDAVTGDPEPDWWKHQAERCWDQYIAAVEGSEG